MRTLALLLLASLPLQAQGPLNPLSYPQETMTGSSGNLVPFGVLSSGSFAEGHTQLLIPDHHLPSTGGVLMGMAVHCQSHMGPLVYTTLNIDASIATVTTLGLNFAGNMLAPMAVLRAQNLTVTYSTAQWTPVMFTTPFVYPGSMNLVIDIQKVVVPMTSGVATMECTSDPARTDLPRMVYEFGGVGSGMSTAPNGRIVVATLQVQLLWAGIPTLTLKSDRFNFSGNVFALGRNIDVTTYGTPGSLFVSLIGLGLLPPVSLPPIAGQMYVNGPTLDVNLLSPGGSFLRTMTIPTNLSLIGLQLGFQSAVLDAVSSLPQWTCAADCFINS